MDQASGFDMDVTWKDEDLNGFKATYIRLNQVVDSWDINTTLDYTKCEKEEANAILLTRENAEKGTYDISLNYEIHEDEDAQSIGNQNIFRNIFRYTVGDRTHSGLGSYVACEIAEGHLSGKAFYDKNRNGVQDEDELSLAGVMVMAKDGKGKIQSTITDASGYYEFKAIRDEDVTVTYSLGTQQTYRFNVKAEGLTTAKDKKSATRKYDKLGENETMNVPLSTFWTLTYDGNGATSGLVPSAQEYDPDDAVATVRVKPDNLVKKYYAFDSWNTKADGSGTKYLPNETLTVKEDMTLYAQWVYGTFNTYLDYRGATSGNEVTQIQVTYMEKYYDKLPKDAKKEGYTFRGWSTSATANQETGGVLGINSYCSWDGERTLYAMWKAKDGFKVSYDTDGGTSVDGKDNIKWTASIVPETKPTKKGYDFAGWTYENQDVSDDATYGSLAKTEEVTSITLIAKWTAKTGYKVTYDTDGGTPSYDDATVAWNQTGLLPSSAPEKEGFAFAGWYVGDTQVTASTTYASLAKEDTTKQVTLKAKWNEVKGKLIHYDTQGGSSINDQEIANDELSQKTVFPTTETVKAGYQLKGWMYKNQVLTEDATYESLNTDETSITLTAVWEEKEYTIVYDEESFANVKKKWTQDKLVSQEAANPTKKGYTFVHWSYGDTTISDDTKVSDLAPTNDTITLKANWKERTYNIEYNSNGGTKYSTQSGVSYTDTGLLPTGTPVKTGYQFSKWVLHDHGVTATTSLKDLMEKDETLEDTTETFTLDAIYTPKTGYEVRYNTTGGSEIEAKTNVAWDGKELLPEKNPTKPGYTFAGWSGGRVTNVTKDTTYADIAESNDSASYITLVATWKAETYTISYKDKNDQEFSGIHPYNVPTSHTYGTETMLQNPTKEKADFEGWYKTKDCSGEKVTSLFADGYTSDITLYANWIEKQDIKGKVQINYKEQNQQQKDHASKTSVILQQKLANEEQFTQVGEAITVTFDTSKTISTSQGFVFENMPKTNEKGVEYDYQVTTSLTNYDMDRQSEAFDDEKDYTYNLLLTFNPETFDLNMNVNSHRYVSSNDLPREVRVKVVFRPNPFTEIFTDTTPVVGASQADPTNKPDEWIYITEHENSSITMKFGRETASTSYPVHNLWNNTNAGYYQFVIDSYVMPDGSEVKKGSTEDPYVITYDEGSGSKDGDHSVSLTLNRKNKITFDANGGSGSVDAQTVIGGETITKPDETKFAKTGYHLDGWYTDQECTKEWAFDTKVSEDTTLYANWVANEYSLTFDNGDGVENTTKSVAYGGKLPSVSVPTKEGATFAGYYTKANGEGDCYYGADGSTKVTAYEKAENLTLYARWITKGKISGTVHIPYTYLNGTEIVTMLDTQKTTEIKVVLQRRNKGEEKYIQVGEELPVSFGDVKGKTEATASFDFGSMPMEDEDGTEYEYRVTTFTNHYDVVYDTNEDGTLKSYNIDLSFTPNNFDFTMNVDATNLGSTAVVPVAVNVKVAFLIGKPDDIFQGDVSGGTTSPFEHPELWRYVTEHETSTKRIDLTNGKGSGSHPVIQTGTIALPDTMGTYYYQFIIDSYVVKDENGNEVTINATSDDNPYIPSWTETCGYYDGNDENADSETVHVTLGYKYDVTFDTNGKGDLKPVTQKVASGSQASEPESDEIKEPGYHIEGWYTDKACSDKRKWDFDKDEVYQNVTLYAKWVANTYKITWMDGQEEIDSVDITYGDPLEKILVPAKEGYNFAGYYTEENGQGTCYFDKEGNPRFEDYARDSDVTLYARWIAKGAISGKVKIEYTYEQDGRKIEMFEKQRLGIVKVVLQRRIEGGDYEQVGDLAEVTFENVMEKDYGVGTFHFPDMPTTDDDGNAYEYRVTTTTTNYTVEYKATIEEDTNPYNINLVYNPKGYNLKLKVDGSSISSKQPKTVNIKVAFIMQQPEGMFDGQVTGGTTDATKWRYITEHASSTTPIPLTGGEGSIDYPVIQSGNGTDDLYYYQFVIDSYVLEDGTEVKADAADNPYVVTYDKAYAVYDQDDETKHELSIHLNRKYEVSFDLQGKGTQEPENDATATQFVVGGNTIPIVPDATKITEKGYTLEGWYKDKDCTEKWNFESDKVTNDMTLYAKWTIQTYQVSHELSHVSATGTKDTISFGQDYEISLQATDATYVLPEEVTVLIGGMPATKDEDYTYEQESGTLKVVGTSITGNLAIYASGVLHATTPQVSVTNPDNKTYYVGDEADDLAVTATGNGTLSYQWYQSDTKDTQNGEKIDGATEANYKPSTSQSGTTYYYCVVTNQVTGDGDQTKQETATSKVIEITVREKLKVTFDLNGHGSQAALEQQLVKENETVTKPEDPTDSTGYHFVGWYKDKEGKDAWNFETDKVTADVTLYAVWAPNEYIITLNNGDGVENAQAKVTYKGELPSVSIPTKEGATFAGYYTEANGGGAQYYTPQGVAKVDSYETVGDMELYASWKEKITVAGEATIHYEYTGESGNIAVVPAGENGSRGERVDKTDILLQRRKEGTTDDYETVTTKEITFNTDVELENDQCISTSSYTFDSLDAIDEDGNAYEYRVTTVLSNYTVEYKNQYDLNLVFAPNNFDVPFTVDAKAISESGNRPTAVNVKVTYWNPETREEGAVPTGNYTGTSSEWPVVSQLGSGYITVQLNSDGVGEGKCSVWKNTNPIDGKTYTSYYQLHVASYVVDGKIVQATDENNPFFVTYGAYGTYNEKNLVSMSAKIDRKYQVAFDLQGKGTVADQATKEQQIANGEKVSIPDATKITENGYTLEGWYKDKGCSEKWNFERDTISGHTTLYANWIANSYQLTLKNGDEVIATKDVTYDGTLPDVDTTDIPTKAGSVFAGYYTADDVCYYNHKGEKQQEAYKVAGHTTLYARWMEHAFVNGTATIHYDYTKKDDTTKYYIPAKERVQEITVSLQRKLKTAEDHTYQTVDSKKLTFDDVTSSDANGILAAAKDYEFKDLDPMDADGNAYEYRVITSAPNYQVTYETKEQKKNMELIYQPDTFEATWKVDAGDVLEKDRPDYVNVKVTYYNNNGNLVPTGSYTGISDFWSLISQHETKSVRMKLNADGIAEAADSLWQHNGKSQDYYYQIAIVSYEVGTQTIVAGSSEDTYGIAYGKACTYQSQEQMTAKITKSYQVAFDFNGHGVGLKIPETQAIQSGNKVTKPELSMDDDHYSVIGWYTNSLCTEEWKFDTSVTSDMTLFAKWELEEFSVTSSLKNMSSSNKETEIGYHERYETTLSANETYVLPKSIQVIVGGNTLDASKYTYDASEGTLVIPGTAVTGNIVISGEAPAIVNARKPILQPLASATYLEDTSKDEVSALTTSATEEAGETFTYQWYRNTENSTTGGTLVSEDATYQPSIQGDAVGTTYYYYCIVTNTISDNGDGGVKTNRATSSVAAITVTKKVNAQEPTIKTGPIGKEYTLKDPTDAMTVEANVNDNGTLTYQWYQASKEDLSDASIISGATKTEYKPSAQEVGKTYYYCVVTNTIEDNGDGGKKTAQNQTAAACINVKEPPIVDAIFFANDNAGTTTTTKVQVGDLLEEPTLDKRDGYKFVGWYTDEAFTTKWNFESDRVTQNTHLYAKWDVCKHEAMGEWVITKVATCTEDGSRTRTCEVCGHTETETIKAHGHQYGAWVVVTEATTTHTGLEQCTCSICGDVMERTIAQLTNNTSKPNNQENNSNSQNSGNNGSNSNQSNSANQTTDNNKNKNNKTTAKTGDEAPIGMLIVFMIMSGAAIVIVRRK